MDFAQGDLIGDTIGGAGFAADLDKDACAHGAASDVVHI